MACLKKLPKSKLVLSKENKVSQPTPELYLNETKDFGNNVASMRLD